MPLNCQESALGRRTGSVRYAFESLMPGDSDHARSNSGIRILGTQAIFAGGKYSLPQPKGFPALDLDGKPLGRLQELHNPFLGDTGPAAGAGRFGCMVLPHPRNTNSV